jgi:Protein of unknown function (DUF2971)
MAGPKILYKYISAARFKKLWSDEKIRFTQLNQLNDPYENRVLDPNVDLNMANFSQFITDNNWLNNAFLSGDLLTIQNHYKKIQMEIDNRFGILALSRNPLNLLMWSHYADEHKGVVIGIDVSDPIFYELGVMINPKEGNIVYSSIKPRNLKLIKSIHREPHEEGAGYKLIIESADSIDIDLIFLYKAFDWAYEEEVRVVRDFSINQGTLAEKTDDVRLFSLPKSVIKEVIFGVRYDYKENPIVDFIAKNGQSDIKIMQTSIGDFNYAMEMKSLNEKNNSVTPKPPVIMKGRMLQGKNNKGKKKK